MLCLNGEGRNGWTPPGMAGAPAANVWSRRLKKFVVFRFRANAGSLLGKFPIFEMGRKLEKYAQTVRS